MLNHFSELLLIMQMWGIFDLLWIFVILMIFFSLLFNYILSFTKIKRTKLFSTLMSFVITVPICLLHFIGLFPINFNLTMIILKLLPSIIYSILIFSLALFPLSFLFNNKKIWFAIGIFLLLTFNKLIATIIPILFIINKNKKRESILKNKKMKYIYAIIFSFGVLYAISYFLLMEQNFKIILHNLFSKGIIITSIITWLITWGASIFFLFKKKYLKFLN